MDARGRNSRHVVDGGVELSWQAQLMPLLVLAVVLLAFCRPYVNLLADMLGLGFLVDASEAVVRRVTPAFLCCPCRAVSRWWEAREFADMPALEAVPEPPRPLRQASLPRPGAPAATAPARSPPALVSHAPAPPPPPALPSPAPFPDYWLTYDPAAGGVVPLSAARRRATATAAATAHSADIMSSVD